MLPNPGKPQQMNRATFLRAFAGAAIGFPAISRAETPVEKEIYDLLDAAIDAQFTYAFPKLATMLHSSTLRLFRNELSAAFDRLLRSYSLEQVAAVSGLPAHPKDLNISDVEIFVLACDSAKDRHPDFVGDEKLLPLNLHGTIFDSERFAHIVYSYGGGVRTERTDFTFVSPKVFTVRREGQQWQVYSCILVKKVISGWWHDLAPPREIRDQQN